MMISTLEQKVFSKQKGQFAKIKYQKELKTRAGFKNLSVVKISEVVARFGVQYDNITNVKNDRIQGILPQQNAGLPWGTWRKYPFFIEHKGTDYLRISLANGNKIRSVYYVDGKQITKTEASLYCLASEFTSSGSAPDILTIKANNILDIR